MKRKALGKGLRSLIPEAPVRSKPTAPAAEPSNQTEGLRQIDIDLIQPNREQPREDFDEIHLEELAASLKEQGVLQPVLVRPAHGGRYELIAGERRWRAAQLAGLMKLPAVVRDVPDERLLEIALIENIQREELNAIEEATAYQTLINETGLTQQQIADRVGKQRATVTNALRLLNLPTEVQDLLRVGLITSGHAKALAALANSRAQIELAQRVVAEGLSVRNVESEVARSSKKSPARSDRRETSEPDPNVAAAEERLQGAIGTRVRIIQGRSGKGRLELHFFSPDELDRLYEMVLNASRQAG